jgi:molecular chaperone DnaJ
MTKNPYIVLGVPETATDQEIKKAYRNLAKRYHPDANPGDKVAEQKMKEINVAYDQLINKKNTGHGGTSYQRNDPFGGTGGFGDYAWQNRSYQTESAEMRTARNYINIRDYYNALNVLNNMSERTARWYYYSAMANAGAGNRIQAQQYAQMAVQMEPGNTEYLFLLARLQNMGQTYTETSRTYRSPIDTAGRFCFGLCLLNLLARLFGFC